MKKTVKIISVLLFCVFMITQLCACDSETLIHVHSFAKGWTSNGSCHWHAATCEHSEYMKDMAEHTFGQDGICTVCGRKKSDGDVIIEPYKDKYYLPEKMVEYTDDELVEEIKFEYDSDLHGFTETRRIYLDGYDEYRKDVYVYKFNKDYSTLTYVEKEYEVEGEIETLTRQRKYQYEYYENSSYKVRLDEYDLDSKEYVFQNVSVRKYNENDQMILNYEIYPGEKEGTFYYSYIDVYEYDASGRIMGTKYYSGYYCSERVAVLESFSTYEYAEDGKSYVENEYYNCENGYYKDGYSETTVEYKDGIRYETQVIHNMDGTTGNTNKFGYDESGELVYVYYGGFPQEARIEKNQYGQIIRYEYSDDTETSTMEVTYGENGGNVTSSVKESEDYGNKYILSSTYGYNDNGQMTEATRTCSGDYPYSGKTTITYKEYKKDVLMKYIELYDSILRNYADNVLAEGLF